MANPTTYFGWVMPNSADLVTDLPADFNVFGQGVDTSMQDLLGGTTGQILSKTSGTNMDFTWINNDQGDITGVTAGTGISGGGTSGTVTVSIDTATTVDKTTAQTLTNKTLTSPALTTPTISTATTNGDILYGTGSGALARLGIGASAQVLTVASGIPSWATPAGGNTGVGCALNRTTDQSISNGTITQLTFDSELFDTDTMHSTSVNPERITIATGQGGYYLWTIKCTWNTNGTGTRQFIPYKNGTRQGGGGGPKGYDTLFDADGYTAMNATFVISLAAGDYISMAAYQDSGGSLDIRSDELFQSVMKLGS